MSTWGLEGRVAIVTGASRGIGWATARLMAKDGAHVVLVSRGESGPLEARAAELETQSGCKCLAIVADVASATDVGNVYKRAFAEFRRLDVLVNNAGMLCDGLVGMISEERIARALDVNLAGSIRNLQMAARLMGRTGGGSIINMSSIMGTRGGAGQVVYSTTKAGIIGMTLAAAKELAPKRIRVNAIAPGYIATDMIRGLPEEIQRARLAAIPLGRIGDPEDVAKAILFLASDHAAYITGQVLGVDGGMVI